MTHVKLQLPNTPFNHSNQQIAQVFLEQRKELQAHITSYWILRNKAVGCKVVSQLMIQLPMWKTSYP